MPGAPRAVSEFPRRQFSACPAAPTPLEAQVARSEDPERRAVVLHLSLILKVPATWSGDLCAPETLLKKQTRGLQLCPGLGPFCKSGPVHPSWNGRTAIPLRRLQPSSFLWLRMGHLLPT